MCIFVYTNKIMLMLLKLVSYSCVDNMQYYDAVVCFPSVEFTITSVYYDTLNHLWSVKLPNTPLFETHSYCELFSFLACFIRKLFYS